MFGAMGNPRLGLFVVVATCRRAAASNASEVATLGTWWQNVDATTDGSLNASVSSWWQGDFMASVVDWLNATNGRRPSLAYAEDEVAYRRWYEHERCAFALPWDETGASFVSPHELETEILGDNTATTFEARGRPSADGVQDVFVNFALSSFDINENRGSWSARGYIGAYWYDPRLMFALTEGCGDDAAVASGHYWLLSDGFEKKIWNPDVKPKNLAAGGFKIRDRYVKIFPYGLVYDVKSVEMELDCDLYLRKFPYDDQACKIVLSSPRNDVNYLRFGPSVEDPVTAYDERTGDKADQEFVKNTPVETDAAYALPLSGTYHEFECVFDFRRKPGFYEVEIRAEIKSSTRLQCGDRAAGHLFVIISYVGFFINASVAPARVAITVIPVLIMRTLLSQVSAKLQIISYLTCLSKFLLYCQFLTVFAVLEYGFVQICLLHESRCRDVRTHLNSMKRFIVADSAEDAPSLFDKEDASARDVLLVEEGAKAGAELRMIKHEMKHVERLERSNPCSRSLDELRLHRGADATGDGLMEPFELAIALRSYAVYIAPSQARKAMINQKYEHGGDDAEIDHATVAFTFAEFLHYVVHYDENPTTFNGRRSWAEHFNPPSTLDELLRPLPPPLPARAHAPLHHHARPLPLGLALAHVRSSLAAGARTRTRVSISRRRDHFKLDFNIKTCTYHTPIKIWRFVTSV
ncbi:extracellular ligand-gated ion channel [Aureococcus anophagefferens]|nr:extracellular ligand-gated ion channel [Aureococcus anophagefferens]